MQGIFSSTNLCKSQLYNQGYMFYTKIGETIYFYNKVTNNFAEIVVYPDGSASAVIGEFK